MLMEHCKQLGIGIIMVYSGKISSYRSGNWIRLWSCFDLALYLPSASIFSLHGDVYIYIFCYIL